MKKSMLCVIMWALLAMSGQSQVAYFDGEFVVPKGAKLTVVWDHPEVVAAPLSLALAPPDTLKVSLVNGAAPVNPASTVTASKLLYFRVRSAPKISGLFPVIATIWPVAANQYAANQWKWTWTADTYRELFVTAWYEVTEATGTKLVESPGSNHIRIKVVWPGY